MDNTIAVDSPLRLTPEGLLLWVEPVGEVTEWEELSGHLGRLLAAGFAEGAGAGLLVLATKAAEGELPSGIAFWRIVVREYLTAVCHIPRLREDGWQGGPPIPAPAKIVALVECAPPVPGMEYLSACVLERLWEKMNAAVVQRIAAAEGNVARALAEIHPVWRLVGRVTLHLAENKRSAEFPFAFLATYSHRLDARSRVQYLPLAQALRESAQSDDRAMLQTLLAPLHAASEKSALVRGLVDSREIFGALAWTPEEAHRFLLESEICEEAGLLVRIPNWWNAKRPPRPQVTVTLDTGANAAKLGAGALLGFNVAVAVRGEVLTEEELARILASDAPLISLKGQWIEVDRNKLREALDHWQKAARAHAQGIPFHQGLRWLAGFPMAGGTLEIRGEMEGVSDWSTVAVGENLAALLTRLRDPAGLFDESGGVPGLRANLRPYQKVGVAWMKYVSELGLGACLADDMGLGKTVQVISLLLLRRAEKRPSRPSLLVVPASLLGNWRRELEKFAPGIPVLLAHRSALDAEAMEELKAGTHAALQSSTVVITTYALLGKSPGLLAAEFDVVALDEAQAIKNAGTAQTRMVKKLQGTVKLALSGTPVENRLDDLWSLFDFLNPGLLGSAKEFAEAARRLAKSPQGYAPLRRLVQPYILRRMKTDPDVAPDLPGKNEMAAFCSLSRRQGVLYQRVVAQLAKELAQAAEGIQRQGVVLAALMKLKQICNHPSLWSGDATYQPDDSGKFERLREICTAIADRQEKALIFTQFAEMTVPLAEFVGSVFQRPGLVLHGGTPVGKRAELVERFQAPTGPPFFVISVKAGGTGLTLTAASHVIHFDRWWNPAVEDQATDRAFRIGQMKSVLVHKFICQGTLEERIDQLIRDKRRLAADILGQEDGAAKILTEMNSEELLEFVRLDVGSMA